MKPTWLLLLVKDYHLELRKPYVLNGILLHTVSTVFISYLAFGGMLDKSMWNALYWIILVFSAVNAVSRSFQDEHSGRHLYYYSLVPPISLVIAKMMYNTILVFLLALITWGLFMLFLGSQGAHHLVFLIAMILGSFGFSLILTLVAAIASRAGNNFTLMAILSFPVMLPLLLILIQLSQHAFERPDWMLVVRNAAGLLALNAVVVVLAVILFPYLWKE